MIVVEFILTLAVIVFGVMCAIGAYQEAVTRK